MAIFALFLVAIGAYLAKHLYSIYKNYMIARPLGLPIIISPLDPYGIPCMISIRILTPIFKKLPFEMGTRWCRVANVTWAWETDGEMHTKLGANFVVVTPARNMLNTVDPETIKEVFARKKDFLKPDIYSKLECFGVNVNTVDGKDWDRHRKLTSPCFNEGVSSFVWEESLRQAGSMLSIWLSKPSGRVSNMVEDTRIVALHVLSAAGFGVSHDFSGGARLPGKGHELSHKDALITLLNNLVTTIILCQMRWLENFKPILSSKLCSVFLAMREFGQYMDEMLDNERQIIVKSQGSSKPNLISTLIRTSDEAKAEGISSSNVSMSDDEIKGNLFFFHFAGHDTTSNSLAYSVALLAAYPEIQNWVIEEVDRVLDEAEKMGKPFGYEAVFPKMKRLLAVMYEVLRLYTPVPSSPRKIANESTLVLADASSHSGVRAITFPAKFEVAVNSYALHTRESIFPNATLFNPQRWIDDSGELIQLKQGYWPWSGGSRVCPGMKFAQVEFIAVISTILRGAKLMPAVKDREVGFEEAQKEVLRLARLTDAEGPTLSFTKPEELYIKVVKR